MANNKDEKNGRLLYFPGCDKAPAIRYRIVEGVLPLYEALALIGEGVQAGAGARIMLESEHERARNDIRLVFDAMIFNHAWKMRYGSLEKIDPECQAHERIRESLPLAAYLIETLEKIFPKVLESSDVGAASLFWSFQDRVRTFLSNAYYLRPSGQSGQAYLDELEPMIAALMKSCKIEGGPMPLDAMPQHYSDSLDRIIREYIETFNRHQPI